ncbi:GNAT family N-acetyltransferase [Lacrimispora algidixylanolytica]|uniref:GNAT family N-acetyltransferase n=1 Tax=Lacrimispora algidixylanolytica TaxID=94868 RepID=A0A419T7L8_9FIRM|nr:GNAT family N-acetyltransferase [Lacrimispora algidixylanolytica]RKD33554.1 GNAT family N-acetyltransferase [Lacrimispora algidixylanolytica]
MNFIYNPNQIAYFHSDNNLLAEVTFPNVDENTVDINHTFVDDSLRGQGVAGKLMEATALYLRSQGKTAVLTCSYAISWFEKHAEYQDILK